MSLFRRIVLLLLVISLPGYGWAFTGMPACAMQHQSMQQQSMQQDSQRHDATQQVHASHVDAAAAAHSGHCCAEQPTKHGDASQQGCQDGQQCQCSALYQATQPLTAMVMPGVDVLIQAMPFQLITTAALPLWRPPARN